MELYKTAHKLDNGLFGLLLPFCHLHFDDCKRMVLLI